VAIPKGTYGNDTVRPRRNTNRGQAMANRNSGYDRAQQNRVDSAAVTVNRALQQQMAMQAMGGDSGWGGSGGGRGGGRGGGGGYASQAAADEKRRAAQRALVEQLYNQQVGNLGTSRDEAMAALPGFLHQALGSMAGIDRQNRTAGTQARSQIGADTRSAQGQLTQATRGLQGDLQGQGVPIQALLAANQSYGADAGARGAAANNFNSRLAAIMALAYGDARTGAATVNQGAQATAQTNYQQALAALQGQRASSLMELA